MNLNLAGEDKNGKDIPDQRISKIQDTFESFKSHNKETDVITQLQYVFFLWDL